MLNIEKCFLPQVLTTREQQNLKLSVRYLDDPSSLNVDNFTVNFQLNLTPLNDRNILFGSNTVNLNNRSVMKINF